MGVARRVRRRHPRRQAGRAAGDRLQYALGDLLIYGPLRNVLGMSRVRVAYTAGAAIGPDLFRFYRSIGINLKQLYGSTETCAYVCLQPDGQDQVRHGRPAGARRRGRRSPTTARCSCAAPMLSRSTTSGRTRPRKSIDAEGYFHTGDAGFFDARRPPEDHRPRERRRQARRRRGVRAQLHREQAQVLPVHQGSGRLRQRARPGLRVHQHRHGRRSATGPSGAASPIRGYTDLAAKPRGLRAGARAASSR